jgi:hypothetical protein
MNVRFPIAAHFLPKLDLRKKDIMPFATTIALKDIK